MTNIAVKILFLFYEILWILVTPFLKNHKRIGEGFEERKLKGFLLTKKDIWIQAASAGEAYLVETLLEKADHKEKINILLTTCTSQGIEILEKVVQKKCNPNLSLEIRYLPFDKPSLMNKAVKKYNPKIAVILETEIWPGLFYALKKNKVKTIIVNGRITEKSMRGYKKISFLWPKLAPSKILATKELDAKLFNELFQTETCVMNNIKFERIAGFNKSSKNPLKKIVSERFLVLGSVREEEEEKVTYIINEVLKQKPETVIGLFPRHMHRIESWQKIFEINKIKYTLRSEIKKKVNGGEVILWDTFGELSLSYEIADAVFVGGSLADLGGQNFLEPVMCGVIPVIGPSWDNFLWLGNEIVEEGLVTISEDEVGVAQTICENLSKTSDKSDIMKKVGDYLKSKRGGAKKVWENILE